MSNQIECPVCGKVGIPDYHKEIVVCPCCGSDLAIYKILADSQAKESGSNNKSWKLATAVFAAVAILASLVLLFKSESHAKVDQNEDIKDEIAMLRDSIHSLTKKLNITNQQLSNQKVGSVGEKEIIYIVKRNDSPWMISKKLYGTGKRYKEISAIVKSGTLHPGDTLYIKK